MGAIENGDEKGRGLRYEINDYWYGCGSVKVPHALIT